MMIEVLLYVFVVLTKYLMDQWTDFNEMLRK